MKVKIASGNSKLGKIPNVSIIPVKDCGNCESCKKDCYALKAWKQYPSTRAAWSHNSALFRANPAQACQDVADYCQTKKPRFFRWNVAGDILGQAHLDGIKRTAKDCPETKFLIFTKMHGLKYGKLPPNLKVVFSMFPSMAKPRGNVSRAWYQDGTEKRIPTTAIECTGFCEACGMCWGLPGGQDVYFIAH